MGLKITKSKLHTKPESTIKDHPHSKVVLSEKNIVQKYIYLGTII